VKIGAAIGFSVAAILVVAYKQREASQIYATRHALYCDAFMASEDQRVACKEEDESAKGYLPWWFELFRWPEGITAWAIIATGFVIAWQAYETRKATEATESSAAAALLNTQIQIRSDRAWIVVSVDESPVGVYRFWAENKGKTPATIASFWGESLYVERSTEYVEKPEETTRQALLQVPRCLMPPGDKRVVWECHRSAIEEASGGGEGEESRFSKGFGAGFIYGRIRYFDVLDAKPEEPHETRWLYWLNHQPIGVPIPHPLHPERNTYS
jgi:hypothetical protein